MLLVCLMALSVAGCGGGGSSNNAQTLSVSVSGQPVTCVGFAGQAFAPKTVTATISGGSGSYYFGIRNPLSSVLQIGVSLLSKTSAQAIFMPVPGYHATAGELDGTVTFLISSDPGGNNVVWSDSIPVRLVAFGLSQASVLLSAPETSSSPLSAALGLTPADPSHWISATVTGANWLSAVHDSTDSIGLTAAPSGVSVGSYANDVRLTTVDGSVLDVPVTLTISSGINIPPAQTLTLTASTAPADLSGSMGLSFASQGTPGWTVSSDKPWLVFSPASGSGQGPANFTVDPSKINGGSDTHWSSEVATVTIASPGLTAVTTQVQVVNGLPAVTSAYPPLIPVQTAATVHLRGSGFSQLPNGSAFKVGGSAVLSGSVVSDHEAVVQVGPMDGGTYEALPILPINAPTASAEITVNTPAPLPAAYLGCISSLRSACFDDQRQVIYCASADGRIEQTKYDPTSGSWAQTITNLAPLFNGYVSFGDFGLSPDGKTLLVTGDEQVVGHSDLLALDPDSLALVKQYPYTMSFGLDGESTHGLAASWDGEVWITGLSDRPIFLFDSNAENFVMMDTGRNAPPLSAISLDRACVLAGGEYFSGNPEFDSNVGFSALTSLRLDANGGRILEDGQTLVDVANGSAFLGAATDGVTNYFDDGLISPDGTRIYRAVRVLAPSGNAATVTGVDVFDTTQGGASDPSGHFVKVGSISLDHPFAADGTFPQLFCNLSGDTLFLASGGQMAVFPVPPALRPALAASPSSRLLLSSSLARRSSVTEGVPLH